MTLRKDNLKYSVPVKNSKNKPVFDNERKQILWFSTLDMHSKTWKMGAELLNKGKVLGQSATNDKTLVQSLQELAHVQIAASTLLGVLFLLCLPAIKR